MPLKECKCLIPSPTLASAFSPRFLICSTVGRLIIAPYKKPTEMEKRRSSFFSLLYLLKYRIPIVSP